MTKSDSPALAAELLKHSGGAYAGMAATLMLEQSPDLRAQAGAFDMWRAHLSRRALELAAALSAQEPRLFSERVLWSRDTFVARDREVSLLELSLECLRRVIEEGMPAGAAGPAAAMLAQAITGLRQAGAASRDSAIDPGTAAGKAVLGYLQQVLEGDGAAAVDALCARVRGGELGVQSAYLDLLLPAQKEIGRLWHANEVSVAEEHLVTAATQRAMALLAHSAQRKPANGSTVVAACVAGNAHDIAIRALADLLYLEGWRSVYLGADVPGDNLPATLDAYDASLLVLSCTLSTHLERAADAVAGIRKHHDRRLGILVGGAAFDEAPALAERIGADAYTATIGDALQLSAQWVRARD